MKIKKIENRVREIFKLYPATRDDDMLLLSCYYERYYNTDSISHLRDSNAEPPESITRVRRKIQEGGEYQSGERARERRKKIRSEFKQYALGVDKNQKTLDDYLEEDNTNE